MPKPATGEIWDGYRLLRLLGSGGFGEVWLCTSTAMGDWRALKFIAAERPESLQREHAALVQYRKLSTQLRSPYLMPVEHVNCNEDGLFYVMPLADGVGADSPEDAAWHPRTLDAEIEIRRAASAWFSSAGICALFSPVLEALQLLSGHGLAHRDIKPGNILFFGGQPCLADISLLAQDETLLSRCGTPGFMAPSWYSGGHPDMFSAALTLYALLTGNPPDRFGRAAYFWPPQGRESLSAPERTAWERLHAIVRRAVEERPAERFSDFTAFRKALTGETPVKARRVPVAVAVSATVAFACLVAGVALVVTRKKPMPTLPALPPSAVTAGTAAKGAAAASAKAAEPAPDGYQDLFAQAERNIEEFTRHTRVLLKEGGSLSGSSAMLTLAARIGAERLQAELDALPEEERKERRIALEREMAAPANMASCLELALLRLNEGLFTEASRRPDNDTGRAFFATVVAPRWREVLYGRN
jgi:serine/threonine-protein kinase